jgi:4-hydroxybenzoate polyprenyltransferase
MYWQMQRLAENIVNSLEREPLSLVDYFLGFIFITFLRHFAESYSQVGNYLNLPSDLLADTLIHYTLSYFVLALLLALLFYYATQTAVHQVLKVIFPCFILIWCTPLLDLLFSKGEGTTLLYLQPGYALNVWHSYVTFLGDFSGATRGLRCEVFVALIGCFFYFRVKQLSLVLSLLYTWMSYSLIFIWGSSPFFLKWFLQMIHQNYQFSGELMSHFYLVVMMIASTALFYLANQRVMRALLKDIRLLRILHYLFMLLLGVVIALTNDPGSLYSQWHVADGLMIHFLLCSIGVFFSCLFSLVTNNLADIEIDRVSNPERPLVSGEIDPKVYRLWGHVFLVMAFFYAAMVNTQAVLLIGVTLATYYLYSMPPLRLKRVTLFSKLAISVNSIALMVLGYTLVQDHIDGFPRGLYGLYLVGVTLAANLIDLKDVEGDAAAGIITVPVLLGKKQAKIMIGLAFWATYVAFFYLIKTIYALPVLVMVGGVQFFLINKKEYDERPILVLYILSVVFLMCYLLGHKIIYG